MDLLQQIKDAGIIGAGGAGFPTHVKLKAKAEYIILNGAECEPLLRVDQQIMDVYSTEIIKGLETAGRLVGASKAYLGVKLKHKALITKLKDTIIQLGLSDYMELAELKDMYPAGDEQVLVCEVTGRIVPERGLPLDVGCVVINSETALNIYNSISGKAVTETYITVAGDVPERFTCKVPVGISIRQVLEKSGVANLDDYAVIDGGPMMGNVLSDINGYVTKKSKGYVLLKKTHSLIKKKSATEDQMRRINQATCEQCRMCTDLCPRYLLGHSIKPHMTMRGMLYRCSDVTLQETAQLCCQCGVCELFACPVGLYPKSANVYFMGRLNEIKHRYERKTDVFTPRKVREFRAVPSKRLINKLGLHAFDQSASLVDMEWAPEYVRISMVQHVGAPSKPIVAVNDSVLAGQMIAAIPEGALGANVHSSIDGTIEEITPNYIAIRRK
ncbi:4Fe-4S dicluster domain-containing protein [Lacrimispora sp.]|uniref:4Fe-4S dicluster domain-containing protein n=1 Tax=Lacrimispora sp. TaxID=2719234 RepID=UPI002FDA4B4D